MEKKGKTIRPKNSLTLIASLFVFTILCGCKAPSPAGDGQSAILGETDYITATEAKNIVLENSGLSEEQIRFVRFRLDTTGDSASYAIEFINETEEYDYQLNAVTGEILAMNCEMVSLPPKGTDQREAQESESESTQENTQKSVQTQNAQNGGESVVAEDEYIGREAAKQTALNHAGLAADDVNFTHVHLEFDDGCWKYDVEFHHGQEEYDYDIDAVTGEILAYDRDADYKKTLSTAGVGTESGRITEAEAKRLALQHAGISENDAQSLKIEFDYDDGRAEYEVEWYVGRTEYACDVDAYTGDILSFEVELD